MTDFLPTKVLVFGSSSLRTSEPLRAASYKLGELIAETRNILVFGGGIHGCMGAVQDGCHSKGGRIIGVIHEMFLTGRKNVTTEKFEQLIVASGTTLTDRKKGLYDNCDCIIVAPGGVGTFDELMETICLRSLKMNNFQNIPICLLNTNGFYDATVQQMNRAAEEGLLYGPVESYFHVSDTPEEALQWCLQELSAGRNTAAIAESDELKGANNGDSESSSGL